MQRGGVAGKAEIFDAGQLPADRVVILKFENMDKVKAWRDAARDAQERIGSKYAIFRTFAERRS